MKRLQSVTPMAFIIVCMLIFAENSNAATFTVTNTNDNGQGSLRQAILDANTNNQEDTIVFDPTLFSTPQTITLTSGQLEIAPDNASGVTKLLTINSPGAHLLTISGNNQSRVISVERIARIIISGVKITAGNGVGGPDFFGAGGGILVKGGFAGEGIDLLILRDSIITGNQSLGSSGGGIALYGSKNTVINTLITNNTTPTFGGGVSVTGSVEFINTTISGNTTGAFGAGIWTSVSNLYLTNSTVAHNRVTNPNEHTRGGGIYQQDQLNFNSYLYSRNSIIANNFIAGNNQSEISGRLVSSGYNIIGNSNGVFISGNTTGDQMNVNPRLDPVLRNNGGLIPTHALSASSTAIDRGDNCVLNTPANGGCLVPNITTDQRGVMRPQDGDKNGTATVDIGAFEASTTEVSNTPNQPDLNSSNDTGVSNSDNITRSRDLSFEITNIISGAIVELFRDGVKIAEIIAGGNTVTFTDNNLPANGLFIYSARQIINNAPTLLSVDLLVIVDNTAPTVTINQATVQMDPTNSQPVNFAVTFNEAITGYEAADISLAGSSANVSAAIVTLSRSTQIDNVTVSNITSDGTIRASLLANAVQDIAGNSSLASTSTDNTITLDTISPTVIINQSASQTDPTRFTPVNFTVVFSEPVTGFNNADISLAGSTANVSNASITVTGSGATYNVAVSNFTSNGGFIQARVPNGAATDGAGNSSAASTSTDNTVTVDNVAPAVTINQANSQADPTASLPINFTVVFNEAVTGFDATDISFTGSTISTTGASINVTGSGTTYNVAIGNITSNGGILQVSVRPGTVIDSVGNLNLASTSTDNRVTIDNVAPVVTINQAINQADPTSTQPVNFTVVFSETVTGFDAADISLNGSTAGVSSASINVAGSGNVYTVSIGNIISSGQVRASIIAAAAQDAVGNVSMASTSTDNIITVNVKRAMFDYDGDGKADVSVFRPENGGWYISRSSDNAFFGTLFGQNGDLIAPADFDGDGKTDISVFREGFWYRLNSSTGAFVGQQFGSSGDKPMPGDFDGDGKADISVFRPSSGTWYRVNSSTNEFIAQQFGTTGDLPQIADLDGDGKSDLTVFRPSTGGWYASLSSNNTFFSMTFGTQGDIPTPADYDGDGKTDISVFRPSAGSWYRTNSSNNAFFGQQFGVAGDLPVAADYDGDGRADIGVFRQGNWYLLRSTAGFTGQQFGTGSDTPTPFAFAQ